MADKDFTPREMEIMAKAWNCFTEEPKVDYKKLAAACDMTNTGSAANAWRNIKAKILYRGGITKNRENGGEAAADGASTPKSTPRKRGKGKADAADGESPTKKAKGGKGKKVKKEESAEADEEDGEEDGAAVKEEKGEEDD